MLIVRCRQSQKADTVLITKLTANKWVYYYIFRTLIINSISFKVKFSRDNFLVRPNLNKVKKYPRFSNNLTKKLLHSLYD